VDIINIAISILALIISLSTFIYTIYKDNKESIILRCLQCKCNSNNNEYTFSVSYIVINNSHKNVSIIRAYVTYDGLPIHSSVIKNNIFPINLSVGESYQIDINSQNNIKEFDASHLKLSVVSAKNKIYSAISIRS